jgi:hypothetical protein
MSLVSAFSQLGITLAIAQGHLEKQMSDEKKVTSKVSEIDRAVREGRTETFTRPFPKPSESTQTVVAVCERCEDYDKILEQYAESAGKTFTELRKALKEARETAPAVVYSGASNTTFSGDTGAEINWEERAALLAEMVGVLTTQCSAYQTAAVENTRFRQALESIAAERDSGGTDGVYGKIAYAALRDEVTRPVLSQEVKDIAERLAWMCNQLEFNEHTNEMFFRAAELLYPGVQGRYDGKPPWRTKVTSDVVAGGKDGS